MRFSKTTLTTLSGSLSLLLISVYYYIEGFNVAVSDIGLYRLWSYDLLSHLEPLQLPGLPALLAFFRFISFNVISDIILMVSIVYFSWLILIAYTLKILDTIAPETKDLGVLLISFFPFFGVSMIAYPAADIIAHALFFCTIFYSLKFEKTKFLIFFIMSTFIHKVLWPFLILLAVLNYFDKKIDLSQLIYIFIPIFSYYLLIYFSLSEISLGIFSNFSTNLNLTSNFTYPLNGIFENFYENSLISVVKGILLLTAFISSVLLIIYAIRSRNLLLIALTFPIMILGMFVNEFTATSLIRHCKVLVIPFCVWLSIEQKSFLVFLNNKYFYITLLILLILSQLVFGWYQVFYETMR